MTRDTANVWQYFDLRVDPDPLCTSYQISTVNENPRSKTPLNTNTPFKWEFMDIITALSSKILTQGTTFYNYLLIMDAYSKLTRIYVMENISHEECMDKP